ncbi:MAG: lysophospholipase [Candidatus Eremiobacteraeota bacterium]|nr:lysophospholipase [Candidatus Eremiobacteraeota bacterium]
MEGKLLNLELLKVPAQENKIAVLAYEPRRERRVSLVVGHGYSSSKHNLDVLCNFLASHGFAVYSLDFPGHKLGASCGRLRSVDDLIDAMRAVVDMARKRDVGPIYTLGHSMGAMTALFSAALDPKIAGAVAIATGYGRPSALETLQSKGSDLRASYVEGASLPELMIGVDERYQTLLPRLAGRPVLYVAADRDMMVNKRSVEQLYDKAPEPKTFALISSDHTYAGENARTEVLQWLNGLHPRR